MAEPLPPALKIPEVSRFVNRANQLRTIRPAIAYWCEYHAVNQIVAQSLHTTSDAAFTYTKLLLERLESTKNEHTTDETITDNTAAEAYVRTFAQQTFSRAERTLLANKVTRQTADTFDAAATFFDLLREWGELDAETLQKIKFAKWNAARILKAIREGRDPNESNPNLELEGEVALDFEDPEVRAITGGKASVEDVEDEGEPSRVPLPGSVDAQPDAEEYFPPGPDVVQPPVITIPDSPPASYTTPDAPPAHSPPSPIISTPAPQEYYTAPPPQTHYAPAPATAFKGDYKDLNQAQKHAKFAISALNFEDVGTAVEELRKALAALGH